MDEAKQPHDAQVEPDLKRPEEAVEDLEPDRHEADDVKGGFTYQKIAIKYET